MKNLFFLLFAIPAFSSCTHYYYMPAAPNVPLFKEKNEVRATASIGASENTDAVEAHIAYAATNHIAIASSYLQAEGGEYSTNNGGKGQYMDCAVGYFQPIKEQFVFEVFGGYGQCQQWHRYADYETANLSFNKVFLQPSIGFTHRHIDVAITPTLSRIHFDHISYDVQNNQDESEALQSIAQQSVSYLLEPTFTIRGGWDYIKLQAQVVSSSNLSHPNLPFEKSHVNLGISFAFAPRMLKKNNPPADPDRYRIR